MIEMVTVTKDVAKRMIDEAPGDMVTIITIATNTHVHSKPKRREKEEGKKLIDSARKISYQDNDFFGRMSLYGVKEENNNIKMVHNILFPQIEWRIEHLFEVFIDKNVCLDYTKSNLIPIISKDRIIGK